MMSRSMVAGAVVVAFGVGAVAALAVPRQAPTAVAQESAQPVVPKEWASALALAAVSERLEGMTVALLVADDASQEDVDATLAAIEGAGARVTSRARLGSAWWDPAQFAFRVELGEQLRSAFASPGEQTSASIVDAAIVMALVENEDGDGGTLETAEQETGLEQQDLPDPAAAADLARDVLTEAGIIVDLTVTDSLPDAVVFVAGEGSGGDTATLGGVDSQANVSALIAAGATWDLEVGATLLVVPWSANSEEWANVTPGSTGAGASIVLLEDARAEQGNEALDADALSHLRAAQVVMALVEQRQGSAGVYGTASGLDLLATP